MTIRERTNPQHLAGDHGEGPCVLVDPSPALADTPVQIRVVKLPAGAAVTLRARMVDDFNRTWESWAVFSSDAHGAVDVTVQASSGGTYRGIDPMGLFWSMELIESPPESPIIKKSLQPTIVQLRAEVDSHTVATAEHTRLWVAEGVERIPVREDGLVGTLFLPPSNGPLPGVIVLGGSGGGIEEGRAALLASHGFAAFALGYFFAEGLPGSLIDIPLEYFEQGLAWLSAHERVGGSNLGVVGASRGGELVLLLGSRFPIIKAVVAYVPSSVVWGGFGKGTDEADTIPNAWTHRGQPIPQMVDAERDDASPIPAGEPIPLTPGFLRSLENTASVEAATIPVEQIRAPILLISGADDAMWPSALFGDMVMERLRRLGHPYADEHLRYDGAGHGIRPPFVPTTVRDMLHPVAGSLFALGGTAVGNAHANADSWPQVIEFFERNLGAKPDAREYGRSGKS